MFSRATFFRRVLAVTSLALALSSAQNATAQTILYVANGDASQLQAIDTTTGSILFSATTSSLAYPIAVRETVSLGHRDNPGLTGNYDLLTGALIGNREVPTNSFNWTQALDGAASASHNYVLQWNSNSVQVYQTDLTWTNPTALFTVNDGNIMGMTYDLVANTLWFAGTTVIYQYDLSGTLVSQFNHSAGDNGGLAYQASTDTLWLVPNDSSLALKQYSKTGALLNSLTVTGRSGNIYGAEFQSIPEPSTYALLAIGGALLVFVNRRRKK
ncbi:PEP-CTERM sorting domain-containing protein [Oleiharenicola lentus]|uniref:PEP-CTERM sorting domain-containing protein n=1 Tax=Oleiharenicola lentus TaxID=2508720 RepID=UPI003F67B053